MILLGVVWTFGRIVLFNDYSTMSVSVESNPDLLAGTNHRKGVYLISYADGPEMFFKNQNALSASAINRGIDFILNYRKSHVDPEFLEKHKDILKHKRGAGYWLWKPQVIRQTLQQVPEGAIVIYADTGFVLQQSVSPYVKMLNDSKKDVMLVECDPLVDGYPIEIAKRDIFLRLNCDEPKCWDGSHVWAAFLMIRNNKTSRDFIDKWLSLCSDGHLLMDDASISPAHSRQKKQHHDEAILSVLYNSLAAKGDDYFYLLPVKEFHQLAFWHHRHPGNELDSTMRKSSYFNMSGLEKVAVLNSYPMKILRSYFTP
jgi:hypothetical protein